MTESPPIPRDKALVQAEFDELCKRAGNEQFQLEMSKAKLFSLNKRMSELSLEFGRMEDLERKLTENSENCQKDQEPRA